MRTMLMRADEIEQGYFITKIGRRHVDMSRPHRDDPAAWRLGWTERDGKFGYSYGFSIECRPHDKFEVWTEDGETPYTEWTEYRADEIQPGDVLEFGDRVESVSRGRKGGVLITVSEEDGFEYVYWKRLIEPDQLITVYRRDDPPERFEPDPE